MSNERLNALLNAAQVASAKTELVDEKEVQKCLLTSESTRPEVLDFIMLYLCERIDLSWNAFKGGFVLTKLLPNEARLTEDIDFSISNEKQYNDLKSVLDSLGKTLMDAGVISEYTIKESIGEHSTGGIHMSTSKESKDIKIDIGWHDLSWGVTAWNYNGFECNRFEVERMLSDKISAIYSRKRFRRPKDIYDVYILLRNFDVDMVKLRDYIHRRGTIEWDSTPFNEVILREYAKAYNKLNIRLITGEEILKPEFSTVISLFKFFMNGYQKSKWSYKERDFI